MGWELGGLVCGGLVGMCTGGWVSRWVGVSASGRVCVWVC